MRLPGKAIRIHDKDLLIIADGQDRTLTRAMLSGDIRVIAEARLINTAYDRWESAVIACMAEVGHYPPKFTSNPPRALLPPEASSWTGEQFASWSRALWKTIAMCMDLELEAQQWEEVFA